MPFAAVKSGAHSFLSLPFPRPFVTATVSVAAAAAAVAPCSLVGSVVRVRCCEMGHPRGRRINAAIQGDIESLHGTLKREREKGSTF